MKPKSLCYVASVLLAGCVSVKNAEDYPNGFQILGHHHYWQKQVGDALFGSNDPVKYPMASGYVTTDADGNVYVSPKLRKANAK